MRENWRSVMPVLLRRDFGRFADTVRLAGISAALRKYRAACEEGCFLCRTETLFCHQFLPYRLEAGLPEKFILPG